MTPSDDATSTKANKAPIVSDANGFGKAASIASSITVSSVRSSGLAIHAWIAGATVVRTEMTSSAIEINVLS